MDPLTRLPWVSRPAPPRPLEQDERLIGTFRFHWISILPALIVYVAFASAYIGFLRTIELSADPSGSALLLAAASIVFFVVHHLCFHALLSYRVGCVVVTDKRVVYMFHKLWLSDQSHDLLLSRIKAVEAKKQGLLQNLCNYGDLWFDTGGSTLEQHQTIPYVPQPHRWAERIARCVKM